ncbi:MAG: Sua5 family C-terminal domain-containing protein [Bacteroidota bacterium]|nr:Sua5 family C-terminal domain-containing protein [Bacteroidota bacterium]
MKIASNTFVIIALSIISMLSMGTIYSWSVFRTPWEDVIMISPLKSGLPFLAFLALKAFSMNDKLHLLDKMNFDCIVAEYVPNVGIGISINDRLRRASN